MTALICIYLYKSHKPFFKHFYGVIYINVSPALDQATRIIAVTVLINALLRLQYNYKLIIPSKVNLSMNETDCVYIILDYITL